LVKTVEQLLDEHDEAHQALSAHLRAVPVPFKELKQRAAEADEQLWRRLGDL
jgi:hypothetical protein